MIEGLYDYQQEPLIKFKNTNNILLCDDMGVGKTVEAIALDSLRREQMPARTKTLVIAPLSGVVDSWVEHFEHWNPDLKVVRINPKRREAFLKQNADVYVMHWEGLRLLWEPLSKRKWLHIIADESHRAKNRKAKQTRALKKVKANYKTALTGTPIINRPDEIWSILNWLYPREYRSYWRFFNKYVEYIELPKPGGGTYKKVIGPKNEPELRKAIEEFYLRRTKKQVLPFLPDKYYTKIEIELSTQERRLYNEMKREMIAWVGEMEEEPIVAPVVIAQLVRLQQFALGTASIVNDRVQISKPSSKLTALLNVLSDMDQDKQVVIFSQSKQMVNLIASELDSVVTFTGDTNQQDRSEVIDEFTSGSARCFVATIRAGGVGLNLQNADTVIFTDRDWSPANNLQAEDRLHRSGQKNAVQVIDIIAKDTIDQGKEQKLQQKWEWIKAILGAEYV